MLGLRGIVKMLPSLRNPHVDRRMSKVNHSVFKTFFLNPKPSTLNPQPPTPQLRFGSGVLGLKFRV